MLNSIQGFIQSVINEPAAFIGVLFLLFVIFMIGYMIAWFFKGGVIRFLLGIFLGYGAFMSFMTGEMLMSKIAFAGGFLTRFFNGWQFLIRWQENTLGFLFSRFQHTLMAFLRSFFPNLLGWLKSLKSAFHFPERQTNTSRKQRSQRTSHDDAFAKAQAKREEEIKHERARQKNKGKQSNRRKSQYHSDRYSSKNQRSQGSEQQSNQQNKDRINGQKQQQSTPPPQQTVDNRTDLEVLGLVAGQTYTTDEIKKAYREQSKKVHPDKWQGKPPAIVEAMEQEMIRINHAYNNLK